MNKICIAIVLITVPFLILILRLHDKNVHPQVFEVVEETKK